MPQPDLRSVAELCELARLAQRLGCRVHLTDVTPALRELLVLAGVDSVLLDDPTTRSGPASSG